MKTSEAKTKYKQQIMEHLCDTENDFFTTLTAAIEAIGVPRSTLERHFKAPEIAEIAREALKERRKGYNSEKVDKALLKKAAAGDVAATKLYYQMVEGFGEKHFHESQHVIVAPEVKKRKRKARKK